MEGRASEQGIRDLFVRNAPAVDGGEIWERVEEHLPLSARSHQRGPTPRRMNGRRIAAHASFAVVIVALLVVGSLEASKHLGNGQPILRITDDTTAGSLGGQTPLAPASDSSAAMFRGNAARAGVYPGGGPTTTPELLWKFKTGESEGSSPVVSDGTVYVAGSDRYLHALDAQSGKEKWKSWHHASPEEWAAVSSPAAADGVVYFGTADGYLCALDAADGREIWKFEAGDEIESSPVVADGVVYFGSHDGFVYALNGADGQEIWKFQPGQWDGNTGVNSSPALSDGVLYFGAPDGYLYALDASSGEERWRLRPFEERGPYRSDYGLSSSPAISDGVIYFATWDSYLYAVDAASGHVKWKSTINDDQSSPAVSGGVVYSFAGYAGGPDSPAVALDASTGEELWRFQKGTMRAWGVGIDPSPSVSGEAVYFLSADDDTRLHALDVTTGEELWAWVISPNPAVIHSSPAISNGVIYFSGNDGYLYALK